ncbi:hypothetical protein KAU33_16960, partial [Candidatus Dependentiae bacterium]|nr:hypothetical protein [Candidatus Dependentiae bacterium]
MKKRIMFSIILIIVGVFLMSSGKIGKQTNQKKVPIIYSKHYNIRLFGIQKLHPFDSEKYGRVYRYLKKRFELKKVNFYQPEQVTNEELLKVHSQEYLSSLNDPEVIASIAELLLIKKVPVSILRKKFLAPMRYATGGTLLGVDLAFEYGWAINLSGGYHHAKSNSGGGFCFFADIPIAVYKLFKKNPVLS